MYTHDLAWNGRQWWVTTYLNGNVRSGMPLDMFLREYPTGEVTE